MTDHDNTTTTPITAANTIQEWLDHPKGGAVLRGFLEQAGSDVEQLRPAFGLPLGQLVEMSGGKMPQEAIDSLVLAANDGVMPQTPSAAAPAGAPGATGQRFLGKTVIVTGAASGIGRATASRLLAEGARVIAADISEKRLAEFQQSADTDQLLTVTADLTDPAAVQKIIELSNGQIHGLANVAGINDDFSAIHEVSDETWARVFAVNIDGLVRLTREVSKHMLDNGGGAIVHVSSEAGLRGSASGVAYTASKHALMGITRSMAYMYAKSGIRTNAIAPGGVATGIPLPEKLGEFGNARLTEARVNMPSLSTADQQASSILWLLSDEASNVNGAILANDGGWSAV